MGRGKLTSPTTGAIIAGQPVKKMASIQKLLDDFSGNYGVNAGHGFGTVDKKIDAKIKNEGREFPKGFDLFEPGPGSLCHWNAKNYAEAIGGTHYIGYAKTHREAYSHSWVVDKDGRVIELTPDSNIRGYIGTPVTPDIAGPLHKAMTSATHAEVDAESREWVAAHKPKKSTKKPANGAPSAEGNADRPADTGAGSTAKSRKNATVKKLDDAFRKMKFTTSDDNTEYNVTDLKDPSVAQGRCGDADAAFAGLAADQGVDVTYLETGGPYGIGNHYASVADIDGEKFVFDYAFSQFDKDQSWPVILPFADYQKLMDKNGVQVNESDIEPLTKASPEANWKAQIDNATTTDELLALQSKYKRDWGSREASNDERDRVIDHLNAKWRELDAKAPKPQSGAERIAAEAQQVRDSALMNSKPERNFTVADIGTVYDHAGTQYRVHTAPRTMQVRENGRWSKPRNIAPDAIESMKANGTIIKGPNKPRGSEDNNAPKRQQARGAAVLDKGFDTDGTWEEYMASLSDSDLIDAEIALKTPEYREQIEDFAFEDIRDAIRAVRAKQNPAPAKPASEPLDKYTPQQLRDGLMSLRAQRGKMEREHRVVPPHMLQMEKEYMAELRKREKPAQERMAAQITSAKVSDLPDGPWTEKTSIGAFVIAKRDQRSQSYALLNTNTGDFEYFDTLKDAKAVATRGGAVLAKNTKNEVTLANLQAAKEGTQVTFTFKGEGGMNHNVLTKRGGKWHMGTADTKGRTSNEVIQAFAAAKKNRPDISMRFGGPPGPFASGQTLPGGVTKPGQDLPDSAPQALRDLAAAPDTTARRKVYQSWSDATFAEVNTWADTNLAMGHPAYRALGEAQQMFRDRRAAQEQARADMDFANQYDTSGMSAMQVGKLKAHLAKQIRFRGTVMTNAEAYALPEWVEKYDKGNGKDYSLYDSEGRGIGIPKMVHDTLKLKTPAKPNLNSEALKFVEDNKGKNFRRVTNGVEQPGLWTPVSVNRGGQGEYVTMRDEGQNITLDVPVSELKPIDADLDKRLREQVRRANYMQLGRMVRDRAEGMTTASDYARAEMRRRDAVSREQMANEGKPKPDAGVADAMLHTRAKQVDTQLADIYVRKQALESKAESLLSSMHYKLGHKKAYRGRQGYFPQPAQETYDAIVAMAASDDTYKGREAQKLVDDFKQNRNDYKALDELQKPLDEQYDKERWSRFFMVQANGGHIHSSMNCSTCNRNGSRTQFGWLPDLSGLTEKDAVDAHGPLLCTVCYPSAPVEWTIGKKNDDDVCPGSNTQPTETRRYGRTNYANCPVCGESQSVTMSGIRKHKKKG